MKNAQKTKNVDIFYDCLYIYCDNHVEIYHLKFVNKNFYKDQKPFKKIVWEGVTNVFPMSENIEKSHYLHVNGRLCSYFDNRKQKFIYQEYIMHTVCGNFFMLYTTEKLIVFEKYKGIVYEEYDDSTSLVCFKGRKMYKYTENLETEENILKGCDLQLYISDMSNKYGGTKCNKIFLLKDCVILLLESESKLKVYDYTLKNCYLNIRGVDDVVLIGNDIYYIQDDYIHIAKYKNRCDVDFETIKKSRIYMEKENEFDLSLSNVEDV